MSVQVTRAITWQGQPKQADRPTCAIMTNGNGHEQKPQGDKNAITALS